MPRKRTSTAYPSAVTLLPGAAYYRTLPSLLRRAKKRIHVWMFHIGVAPVWWTVNN